jgi:hypothetical protein
VAVYDPVSGTLSKDRDLAWRDGWIEANAPGGSLPPRPDVRVLDGNGLCALPPLCDAAVFLDMEGRYPAEAVPSEAAQSLRRQAEAGVGAVLDLNAPRAFIRSARSLGYGLPKASFAGALFTAPGGWKIAGQTPWDENLAEIQEEADLLAPWSRALRFEDQAVFASVECESRDSLSIPAPILKRLGELAHSRGLPFIVQANHASKALAALAARPDAILGPLLDLETAPGLAAALRQTHCAYIPALSTVLNAFPPRPLDAWLKGFPSSADLDPQALLEASAPLEASAWQRHWVRSGAAPGRLTAAARSLADAGVPFAFGTGSGQALVFHGLGAQTEIDHLSHAGLSARTILQSACVVSRSLIGLPGDRLRPGDPADVLLVRGNPARDAASAARPWRIFLAGIEVPGKP